jgi:chromosome segregation ATPase
MCYYSIIKMSRQSTLSKHVSREKYESVKNKGTKWYNECDILKDKLETLTNMNTDLLEQNEDLLDKINDLNDEEQNPVNKEFVDELETHNKSLRKEIHNLKRDNKMFVDKHQDKIIHLERDLFVKDGKIQRLEDSKKDLTERYKELKEDWREERRSNRREK